MREDKLFYEDPYCREIEATVLGVQNGAMVLDRTIFFPKAVNMPSDSGTIEFSGKVFHVRSAVWADGFRTRIAHILDDPAPEIPPGTRVTAKIDWEKRYQRMRAHTALHLVACVLPYPITGGELYDGYGYKDFVVPRIGMAKAHIQRSIEYLVHQRFAIRETWQCRQQVLARHPLRLITADEEASAGRIRAIQIGNMAPEPCEGLHVRNTMEIGCFAVTSIETNGQGRWRVWLQLQNEDTCSIEACA